MRKKAAAAASGERAAGFAALRDPPDHPHTAGSGIRPGPNRRSVEDGGVVAGASRAREGGPVMMTRE